MTIGKLLLELQDMVKRGHLKPTAEFVLYPESDSSKGYKPEVHDLVIDSARNELELRIPF